MKILNDKVLSVSEFSAEIEVDIADINIEGSAFNLPEAEYQRCCPPDQSPLARRSPMTDVACLSMSR